MTTMIKEIVQGAVNGKQPLRFSLSPSYRQVRVFRPVILTLANISERFELTLLQISPIRFKLIRDDPFGYYTLISQDFIQQPLGSLGVLSALNTNIT